MTEYQKLEWLHSQISELIDGVEVDLETMQSFVEDLREPHLEEMNDERKEYKVFGEYTYKVVQKVKADNKHDAIEIAQVHPLCEWDSVERNSYCEKVNYVKEMNDES